MAHGWQKLLPDKGWYLPAAQAVHDTFPVSGWNVPAPQASQFAAPVSLKLRPLGHDLHASTWPAEKKPAAQLVHVVAVGERRYLPAMQRVQAPWPSAATRPGAQATQVSATFAPLVEEEKPAAQFVQTTDFGLAASMYRPGSQVMHAALPEAVW